MKEMLETGIFASFFNFANPILSIPLWLCVAIGFIIQRLIFKKADSKMKWCFAAVLAIAIIVFEGLTHIITGWDLLGVIIIYGGVFAIAIGDIIAIVLHLVKNKAK